jgi:uncharacterized membrane protein YbaN (DUF454 family)
MKKILFISLGSLSLAIGVIGIVVPGLPTTTFLLIAAALYFKSSEKLYNWLLNHKILGKFIKDYQTHRAMPLKSKIIALLSMWTAVLTSIFFFIHIQPVKLVMLLCALIGTIIILRVKTLTTNNG